MSLKNYRLKALLKRRLLHRYFSRMSNYPYQTQYISFAIWQVYFQSRTWLFQQNIYRNIIHRFESFNCDNYVRQAATQIGLLSEGGMIAREAYYHGHSLYDISEKKFANFSTIKKITLKTKGLKAIAVAHCMLFIDDSLQSSDQIAPFIKLSVILKFCCHCLENLKAPVVSINATRLKENLLTLS